MKIDDILDSIAIEEAPEGLIDRWKTELWVRKEAERRKVYILRLYIVLPIIFSGIYYYIYRYKRNWFSDLRLPDFNITWDFMGFHEGFLSSVVEFFNSGNFQTWSIIVSCAVAAVSLLWYYSSDYLAGRAVSGPYK